MNKRNTTDPENSETTPVETIISSEPEYRVNVLLPELKQFPLHVVNAVLVQHGLTAMSLISKSHLVELVEAWLKGAANV